MTIFEIDESIARALLMVDEKTGEWLGEAEYEALQIAREEKIEATAMMVKEAKAMASAISEEIKALQKRKERAEALEERCKNLINMALDGNNFKTAKVMVSYRKSKSVNIVDEEKVRIYSILHHLPDIVKTEIKPVKSAIGKLLDSGVEIDGAERVESTSIIIK